jgi:hypothetical protein
MITSLTDSQRARFQDFVNKWTDIGLSTEPADRVRAEQGIRVAYALAGLDAPSKIIWTTSPLAQGLACTEVYASVSGSALDLDAVSGSVCASVRDAVCASVRDTVSALVRAAVAPVHGIVRDAVFGAVSGAARDSMFVSVFTSGYGQHEAAWLAMYDFFRAIGLRQETRALDGLMEIAQSAGWFLPHAQTCWVSERHHRVCRNSRGQLHSHDGMAVQYPDGWGVWAWHGVRVNEQIILRPDSLTAQQIAQEPNAQVRQVMVERAGIEGATTFKPRPIQLT